MSFPRRQVLWLFETDEGGPGLFSIRGPYENSYDVTPDGDLVNVEINGIVTDLCAKLT